METSLSPVWTTLDVALIKKELVQVAQQTASSLMVPALEDISLQLYEKATSTNELLWQYLQSDDAEGTVVIARQQSAGRGQWGRQWQSPLGGLYLSLALAPNLSAQCAAHLVLCVVWGVAIALRTYHIPVGIKWPNDLVIHRPGGQRLYKLGGILTETKIQGSQIAQAVIGIGLNGANSVPKPGISLVTALSYANESESQKNASSVSVSLNGLAAIAIYGIMAGWQTLQHQGIAPIVAGYNTLLVHRNRIIGLEQVGYPRHGRIIGVTEGGTLRIAFPSASDRINTPSAFASLLELAPGSIQLGYHLNP